MAPHRAPASGRRAIAAALLVTCPLASCYTSRPVVGAPTPGSTVVIDLTDRGRVALGDRIGASAQRIEGTMQAATDSGYVLRVANVQYINGQQNDWSGEPVTVPTEYAGRVRERKFSRSRTIGLGVGITAVLVAVIAKLSLIGGGGGSVSDGGPGGSTGGT